MPIAQVLRPRGDGALGQGLVGGAHARVVDPRPGIGRKGRDGEALAHLAHGLPVPLFLEAGGNRQALGRERGRVAHGIADRHRGHCRRRVGAEGACRKAGKAGPARRARRGKRPNRILGHIPGRHDDNHHDDDHDERLEPAAALLLDLHHRAVGADDVLLHVELVGLLVVDAVGEGVGDREDASLL